MIGTLTIIHKSGIKWDAASSLLVLSVFGWAAGVIPAIIDATIVVNMVMHNTMWVPGHFHFYLLLGMIAMAFGYPRLSVEGGTCVGCTFWKSALGVGGGGRQWCVWPGGWASG